MCTIENEIQADSYEKNNQKVLTDGGVQLYFSNVFSSNGEGRVPVIKPKLKKILVDFGLCQTALEIDQRLNFIRVWYKDKQAKELKGLLLQRFNQKKSNQAIELSISLEGSFAVPPSKGKIKTYTGLTKLLFQEFISESMSHSLVDDNPYNEIKSIIQQGNLSPSEPLESIFRGELGKYAC